MEARSAGLPVPCRAGLVGEKARLYTRSKPVARRAADCTRGCAYCTLRVCATAPLATWVLGKGLQGVGSLQSRFHPEKMTAVPSSTDATHVPATYEEALAE